MLETLVMQKVKRGKYKKLQQRMYEGKLDVEEFLDWIRAMDKYFNYEDVEEEKKVKHDVTRLKGHATLWWDELQADRRSKGKRKIQSQDQIVAKLKVKFCNVPTLGHHHSADIYDDQSSQMEVIESIGVFERHSGVHLALFIIGHHYEPFHIGWIRFHCILKISMILTILGYKLIKFT